MKRTLQIYPRICRSQDEGGSAGGLGDEQIALLNDLIDLPDSGDDLEVGSGDPGPIEENPELVRDSDPPEQVADPVDNSGVDPEPEVDETELTISTLRDQVLQLTAALQKDPMRQVVQQTVQQDASGQVQAGQQPAQQAQPIQQQAQTIQDFLTSDELDRLIDEPQLINVAFQRSQQQMLGSLGSIVQQEVNKQILISRAVTDFYQSNQDLLPYSQFVQFVMAEVEKTNQDKPYSEIFQTTADECRKRLRLTSPATVKQPVRQSSSGTQKPAFAGSKRGNARPAGQQSIFDENARDMF